MYNYDLKIVAVGDVILADMRNGIWWPCIIKNGGFAYFWSDKTR